MIAAAAASLLVGLALGPQVMPRLSGAAARPVPVQFLLEAGRARSVALAGDFTQWQPVPLQRDGDRWVLRMDVPSGGRYQYAFIVNGRLMIVDPNSDEVEADDRGNLFSVLDTETRQKVRA